MGLPGEINLSCGHCESLKTIVNESQFPLDKYLFIISVIKLVVGYDGIHPRVIFTDGVSSVYLQVVQVWGGV